MPDTLNHNALPKVREIAATPQPYRFRVALLGLFLAMCVVLLGEGFSFLAPETSMSRWYQLLAAWIGMAALFVPGALLRRSWRQALAMSVLAAVTLAVLEATRGQLTLSYVYWTIRASALSILLLGSGEFVLAGRRTWRQGFWLLGACLAAVALFQVLYVPLVLTERTVPLPKTDTLTVHVPIQKFIRLPLLTLLMWLAVPFGMQLHGYRRRIRFAGLFGILAAVAFHPVFFAVVLPEWTRESLKGAGPFPRHAGVDVLHFKGNDSDYELMWEELANADWSKPSTEWEYPIFADWRRSAIDALVEHDSATAAVRLRAMLQENPSTLLAEWAAEYLEEEESALKKNKSASGGNAQQD